MFNSIIICPSSFWCRTHGHGFTSSNCDNHPKNNEAGTSRENSPKHDSKILRIKPVPCRLQPSVTGRLIHSIMIELQKFKFQKAKPQSLNLSLSPFLYLQLVSFFRNVLPCQLPAKTYPGVEKTWESETGIQWEGASMSGDLRSWRSQRGGHIHTLSHLARVVTRSVSFPT